MFFFEKKNQKTFLSWGYGLWHQQAPREQKFFAELFFKKATSYLPVWEAFFHQ